MQFPFNASSSTAYPADAAIAPLGLLSYINFDNAGVPTAHFDFTASQKSATAFSTAFESGNIPSPDDASKDIGWQQLLSEDGDLATRIFVINTAGGAAPSNVSDHTLWCHLKEIADFVLLTLVHRRGSEIAGRLRCQLLVHAVSLD